MNTTHKSEQASDVPTLILEKFLDTLVSKEVSTTLVARLRKTLLEDKNFTERALKEAFFTEEPRQ